MEQFVNIKALFNYFEEIPKQELRKFFKNGGKFAFYLIQLINIDLGLYFSLASSFSGYLAIEVMNEDIYANDINGCNKLTFFGFQNSFIFKNNNVYNLFNKKYIGSVILRYEECHKYINEKESPKGQPID